MTKKQEAQESYSPYRLQELDDDLNGIIEIHDVKWQVVGYDYPMEAEKDVMIYGCNGTMWHPEDLPTNLEKRIFVKKVEKMLEYNKTIRTSDVYGSRYEGCSVGSVLSVSFNHNPVKVKILAFRPPVVGDYFISSANKVELASGVITWFDPRLIVEFAKKKKYIFAEDKNGSYIKTTDGTFVNASCHTGTKYRLDVVEE